MMPPIDLTDSEMEAFKELQERMPKDLDSKIYDGDFMYRFLKAKNFDVNQAEEMIKNTILWRKKNGVDTILTNYKQLEVLQKYFQCSLLGYDKEGRPIYYLASGKLDFPGIKMSAKFSEVVRCFIFMTEKAEVTLKEQSKKLNNPITDYIFISNVDGLTFANAADKKGIEFIVHLNRIHHEHYPERLHALYTINASTFFFINFAIVKNFLSSNLMKKFKVFGTEDWIDEFREKFQMDDMPAFLGGEKTDPDGNPLCLTFVNHAGKVDEKYYNHKSKASIANHPNTKKLVLSRAAFSEIIIDVAADDSIIEWEFEIKDRDIGFGLFYREIINGEEQITALVSLERQDTQDFVEIGLFKCEKAGTYIMLFDNSYSWIRSKEIYYKVNVVTVKEHKLQINEDNEV